MVDGCNCDSVKKWIFFGELDLILSVTATKSTIFHSLERCYPEIWFFSATRNK